MPNTSASSGERPIGPVGDESVSEIVHALRSPLSVITGYAALLREQPLSAPSSDFVEAIARSAQDLERRLKDLTDGGQDSHPEREEPEIVTDRGAIEVLCIEDDEGTATLVEHILDGHDGVSVVCAADGDRGLEHAFAHVPDLILLDLHLGARRGEDVLRALRSDDRTVAVPVLVLSGAITPATSADLRACGADAVIAKPFLPDDLRAAVRALVSEPAPGGDEPLDPRYLDALEHLEDAVGLVAAMLGDAQANLQRLRAAVEAGDRETAASRAHGLRGGMANLGAYVVAQECLELEAAVDAGDDAAVSGALVRLDSAMDDAESALHRRLPALRDRR